MPGHAEILATVLDELVHFFKSAFIEKEFDAFADGEFAFVVLPRAAFGAATVVSRGVAAPKLFKAIHRVQGIALHYRFTSFLPPSQRISYKNSTG